MSKDPRKPEHVSADGLNRWLILIATRPLSAHLSRRLTEEWLSDLAVMDTRWSKFTFALGCCWAGAVIAAEGARKGLQPAATHPMISYGPLTISAPTPPYFSLQPQTLFLILGLHAALLLGLMLGG